MNNTDSAQPIAQYSCQISAIVPLNINTFQIDLLAPDDTRLSYHAGQYLKLELDVNNDGQVQSLSYSIASRSDPQQPNRLRLFIQKSSEFSGKVLDCLRQASENQQNINISLAMGRAFLQTDLDQPHVLVAAGSGISKIKCITEEILQQRPDANVNIYWSNRSADDFFLLSEFHDWAGQYTNLKFTAILESADTNWTGRSGYIYEIIRQDLSDLSGVKSYLCGSPQMVYGTIDQLKSRGLQEENCYSDVFEFAPRNHS